MGYRLFDMNQNGECVAEFQTLDDFDNWFLNTKYDLPIILEIRDSESKKLTFGVGAKHSFLQFCINDDPPYMCLTEPGFEAGNVVGFIAGGTPTEIPLQFMVSTEATMTAIRKFIAGEDIMSCGLWKEI